MSWFTPAKDRCPAVVETRDEAGLPVVTSDHPSAANIRRTARIARSPPKILEDEPIRRINSCYEKTMTKDFPGKDRILPLISEFDSDCKTLTEGVGLRGMADEPMKMISDKYKALVKNANIVVTQKDKKEIVVDYIVALYWTHYVKLQSANVAFNQSPAGIKKRANMAAAQKVANAEMARKAWKTTSAVIHATAPAQARAPNASLNAPVLLGSRAANYARKSRKNRKTRKNRRNRSTRKH